MGAIESEWGELAELEEEWDALADARGATPFQRAAWYRAWWRAWGTGTPQVVHVRRDGRLAAVAPVIRRGRTLSSTTNWHTVEFALLFEDAAALAELAFEIYTRRQDRVFLSFLDGGAAETAELERYARSVGYRSRRRLLERSPYLEIDGDWERYVKSRRTKFVANLGRRRRRLSELGELTVECFVGGPDLDRALDDGFSVEGSGWKTDRGTAIASDPQTEMFYRDFARSAAERGWLRLWFLRLDGRPLAFKYGIESDGVQYFLKGGYDPAYKQHSPAQVLQYDVLRACFDSGASRYEFGGEIEPFKLEWTATVRDRIAVQAFAPTAGGRLDWNARSRVWPAVKRARAAAGRLRPSLPRTGRPA